MPFRNDSFKGSLFVMQPVILGRPAHAKCALLPLPLISFRLRTLASAAFHEPVYDH